MVLVNNAPVMDGFVIFLWEIRLQTCHSHYGVHTCACMYGKVVEKSVCHL